MENLDLTVIILSFNTKDITGRCLDKLKVAKDYCENRLKDKIKVTVLDNGSSDGSAAVIKSDYPWVKLIAQETNLGFAKGNNVAIQEAKTPFILLLNSDVYLEEDSLYKALAYFRVNLNCDVMGIRLNYATGVLQPSCGNLPNPVNIISWILGLSLVLLINSLIPPFHPHNLPSKAHQVGWVMGAFFLFKRKIFDSTGGFDEKLFMHMEEVEWCKRIKDQGYKIWYVPFIQVVHLHGASTNFDLSSSFVNELKGIKYYLRKHYGFFYLPVKLILVLGLTLRIMAFTVLARRKRAKVYMEGLRFV